MPPSSALNTLSQIISGHMTEPELAAITEEAWKTLSQVALFEGVAPLLFWTLSNAKQFSCLPAETQHFLRHAYVKTLAKNRTKLKELEALNGALNQADIPMVALKGICYILTIYPNPGLRPMSDIDILVPKAKLDQAVEIAKTLGYDEDLPPSFSLELNDLLRHHVHLKNKADATLILELHYSLVAEKSYTYAVPVEWFWEQTEAPGAGVQTRFESLQMLTPAAQVLYAATHAMLQHGQRNTSLAWFYDLDQLIRYYDRRLDWDLLLSQAGVFEWGSALHAALTQIQTCFDTPIPARVLTCLLKNPDRHRQLVLQKQSKDVTYTHGMFQRLLFLDGYGKFKLLFAHVFPSPAYLRWHYNFYYPWLLPAFYLLHWGEVSKGIFRTLTLLLKRVFTN